jgi:hypothetical protein
MMRKFLLGILGFAAIGLGAATVQPAQAQPYYPAYRDGPVSVEFRGDRGYSHGPRRHGYYRPVFAGPRCFVRMDRAWNGWRWIQQPVRICR